MDAGSFVCPFCDQALDLPEDIWYYTCPNCGHRLDLQSQFAFLRGEDAFTDGQEIMEGISPRQRRKPDNPKDRAAMLCFREAYSSLQVAFKAELAERQRALGVAMMSSMAQEFMKRNMVSVMEMNYWNTLMVEQTARKELEQIAEKLPRLSGLLAGIRRTRLRARQKQLLASLVETDQKIRSIEKLIDFVDVPKTRNTHWKPPVTA